MKTAPLEAALILPIPERIRLVQEILQSISADSEDAPLTQTQRRELRRRLAEYRRDPKPGAPWPDAKSRILRSLARK